MDDSQYEPKLMAWFTKKVGHTCTPSFPLRPTQLIPFFFGSRMCHQNTTTFAYFNNLSLSLSLNIYHVLFDELFATRRRASFSMHGAGREVWLIEEAVVRT